MHRGHMPSIRKMGRELGYKSPRSASMIVEKLLDKGVLDRKDDGSLKFIEVGINDRYRADTVEIPLVGTVVCGTPVFAEENIEAMISVSTKLAKSPYKYFLLRANGDSMNKKGINDSDLVLIRQQATANNGNIVVALIDGEATIKEFKSLGGVIALIPRSKNKKYKPMYLEKDFKIQGTVVAVIPEI